MSLRTLVPSTPYRSVKRIRIHYDNGISYDARDVKITDALFVKKGEGVYLTYKQNTPVEIAEGVLQEPSFAVDMVDVSALDLYLTNGEVITRRFKR